MAEMTEAERLLRELVNAEGDAIDGALDRAQRFLELQDEARLRALGGALHQHSLYAVCAGCGQCADCGEFTWKRADGTPITTPHPAARHLYNAPNPTERLLGRRRRHRPGATS